jgi:glycosyltransferase involved in cell wall biosynthesis
MSSHETPEFSVVITCFHEEQSVGEFHARLRKTLDALDATSEIVMVNDGSADQTWGKLVALHAEDRELTVLDLFRNAGQAAAISAGIQEARGRHFVFMDSDLQLDPEELPLLVKRFREGHDVVNGIRRERQDSLLRRIPSFFANLILRGVAGVPFTDFGCSFQVMRGELVRAHGFGPYKPFSNVLVTRSTARFAEVPVSHHERPYGESGWSTLALWRYLLDNVVLYSQGLFQFFSFLALLVALFTLARIVLPGSGSILGEITNGFLLNAMLLCSALVLAVVAFVGEYVLRTFAVHWRGPLYVVRERREAEARLGEPGKLGPPT